jgi:hypothetical protein
MRLHAYRHFDGAVEIVADHALAYCPTYGASDLGEADVDIAHLSPSIVLSIGLDARALARGADAAVVEHALAVRDAGA